MQMNQHFLQKLGWCLLTSGILIYIKMMVYDVLMFSPRNDFGHLYSAGFLAARGGNFFDIELIRNAAGQNGIPSLNPFVYPPFFALMLIPLSWVSYNMAWLVFNFLSQAAYFASLYLLIDLFRKKNEPLVLWWGGMVLASSLFIPLQKTFMAGQMNTFMLLIITLSWYCYSKQKAWLMGMVLGLGAAVKIAPGFFLLYLLYKRQWVGSFVLLLTVGITLLISCTMLKMEVHWDFLDEVRQMTYGSSTWAEVGQHFHVEPHNQSPGALWQHLLTQNPKTSGIIDSPSLAKIVSYITAAFILLLLIWKTKFNTELTAHEMALWTFGMLWIPSLMWDHYLCQLLFALTVGMRFILHGNTCYMGLFFVGIVLLGMDYPYNFDYPPFKSGFGVLMMSLKLYGSVLLFIFLYCNGSQTATISTTTTEPSSGS